MGCIATSVVHTDKAAVADIVAAGTVDFGLQDLEQLQWGHALEPVVVVVLEVQLLV